MMLSVIMPSVVILRFLITTVLILGVIILGAILVGFLLIGGSVTQYTGCLIVNGVSAVCQVSFYWYHYAKRFYTDILQRGVILLQNCYLSNAVMLSVILLSFVVLSVLVLLYVSECRYVYCS